MDVMQKADVINFPLHSSSGLHIQGLVVLKDGRTASRWRISDDRNGGFALSDGLWSPPSSSSLSAWVSVFAFSLSATFNNSPSGCGTCLGLLWSPPCSPPRLLSPNLSSSGDRNELPTTIGAATVWWRGCRLPPGAKTPWNWRSESVTPLPLKTSTEVPGWGSRSGYKFAEGQSRKRQSLMEGKM